MIQATSYLPKIEPLERGLVDQHAVSGRGSALFVVVVSAADVNKDTPKSLARPRKMPSAT